jgi:hypothetical protein
MGAVRVCGHEIGGIWDFSEVNGLEMVRFRSKSA